MRFTSKTGQEPSATIDKLNTDQWYFIVPLDPRTRSPAGLPIRGRLKAEVYSSLVVIQAITPGEHFVTTVTLLSVFRGGKFFTNADWKRQVDPLKKHRKNSDPKLAAFYGNIFLEIVEPFLRHFYEFRELP